MSFEGNMQHRTGMQSSRSCDRQECDVPDPATDINAMFQELQRTGMECARTRHVILGHSLFLLRVLLLPTFLLININMSRHLPHKGRVVSVKKFPPLPQTRSSHCHVYIHTVYTLVWFHLCTRWFHSYFLRTYEELNPLTTHFSGLRH